jgi:opacity protein-like surface antigen
MQRKGCDEQTENPNMKRYIWSLGAVLFVGSCVPALAQVYDPQQRPLQWHIDAGYSLTTGRTADFLDNGWSIGSGVTWRPLADSPLALRADLTYTRFSATDRLLNLGEVVNQTRIDDGNGQILGLDVDAVFNVPLGRGVRGYLLAGVGVDYRRIDLTQTVAVGGFVCDEWWGFCGRGYFPGDVLVDREETTRFAWNAGVGVEFALYGGQSWFIEARYNRMETQQPTEFIPIRVGLRF